MENKKEIAATFRCWAKLMQEAVPDAISYNAYWSPVRGTGHMFAHMPGDESALNIYYRPSLGWRCEGKSLDLQPDAPALEGLLKLFSDITGKAPGAVQDGLLDGTITRRDLLAAWLAEEGIVGYTDSLSSIIYALTGCKL